MGSSDVTDHVTTPLDSQDMVPIGGGPL